MRLRRIVALATLLLAGSADAAALRVSPIGLDLPSPVGAGAISLTNKAQEAAYLQIRVFKWTMADGEEVLTPTDAVIASPPAASVKPGETYMIRVMRLSKTPPAGEESYRLLIDQLPRPVDPRQPPRSVQMVLRTSLPIFFASPGATSKLIWSVWTHDGILHAEALNAGTRHVRVADLRIETPARSVAFGAGLNGYALPGTTLSVVVTAASDALAGSAVLAATTDSGPIRLPVTVVAR